MEGEGLEELGKKAWNFGKMDSGVNDVLSNFSQTHVMRDYKKLEVWKQSHGLYMHIRKNIVKKFPAEERYVLASQLLRAALSVPLNIVEGCGRYTDKDFAHFLDHSLGSMNEMDYCCFAALELSYISQQEYDNINQMINSVSAMLISF